MQLEAFESSYFPSYGPINFEDDESENYLVFQPVYRKFKEIDNSNFISAWKSKGSNFLLKY